MTSAFTIEQKAEGLFMLDAEVYSQGEICDRIGCSSASLYTWRKQRDAGTLELPADYQPPADLRVQARRRRVEQFGGTLAPEDEPTPPAEPTPPEPTPPAPAEQQTLVDDQVANMEPTPLPVPVPMPNGGSVEHADVLGMSELVAEFNEWRQQLGGAQQRAERAEASAAEANTTIAQLRREVDALKRRQEEALEVAGEELASVRAQLTDERKKAATYRTTMGYLLQPEDDE